MVAKLIVSAVSHWVCSWRDEFSQTQASASERPFWGHEGNTFLIQLVIQQEGLHPTVFPDKKVAHPRLLRRYVAVSFHPLCCCGSNLDIDGECWKQVCVQEALGRDEEEVVEIKKITGLLCQHHFDTSENPSQFGSTEEAVLASTTLWATIPKGLNSENKSKR